MCKCIEQINEQLAELGVEIDQRISFDIETGNMGVTPPIISVRWKDKKPRGKKLPVLVSKHCPFCGERIESGKE